jgi:hypothetical protein
MLRGIRLAICSSLLIVSAGCSVPRPKGDVCIVDAARSRLLCYDMYNDYDKDGKLKAGAKLRSVPSPESFDKYLVLDPDATAELKIYMRRLRERLANSNCKI